MCANGPFEDFDNAKRFQYIREFVRGLLVLVGLLLLLAGVFWVLGLEVPSWEMLSQAFSSIG